MEAFSKENYRGFAIKINYDGCPADPRKEWDNVATFACNHSRYDLGDKVDFDDELDRLFAKYVSTKSVLNYFVEEYGAVLDIEDEDKIYEWKEKRSDGAIVTRSIAASSDDELCELISDDYLDSMDKISLINESDEVVIRTISIYDHGGVTAWLGTPDGHADARWDCGIVGIAFVEKSKAEKEGACGPNHNGYDSWQDWALTMMRSEMKVYDEYLRGEVYGYVIDELSEACYGYYGDSGLEQCIADAKDIIDYHIQLEEELRAKNIAVINENLKHIAGYIFVENGDIYKIVRDSEDRVKIIKGISVNGVISGGDYRSCTVEQMSDNLLKKIVKHINNK